MKLHAEFVASATALRDCPRWGRKEIALVGRSNVGKSSLLNALTGSKAIARVSKTPGRTRALNFFAIDADWALVDLPGFGYAKMSQTAATEIGRLLRDYLEQREQLKGLILLIDSRRGLREQELELISRGRASRELVVVATKSDKLRQRDRVAAAARFAGASIDPIWCSAESGEGIVELRRRILNLVSNKTVSMERDAS